MEPRVRGRAWALLQGIDFLAAAFEWPTASKRIATLASLVGLPIAVVVARYHGEQGKQRASFSELAILALICVVGGTGLWLYGQRSERAPAPRESDGPALTEQTAARRPSIAVLPFENRSKVEDDAYWWTASTTTC